MEEEIKNDLSSIAFSHPFFSDIVGNTLNYIEELEQKNEHYTDLMNALETYYDITEEDLENSVKNDR